MTTMEREAQATTVAASATKDSVVHVKVAGYNQVSKAAIKRILIAVASDTAMVPEKEISVEVADAAGRVDVKLIIPLALDAWWEQEMSGDTLLQRAAELRERVSNDVLLLAGSEVRRLDVRVTGVRYQPVQRELVLQ